MKVVELNNRKVSIPLFIYDSRLMIKREDLDKWQIDQLTFTDPSVVILVNKDYLRTVIKTISYFSKFLQFENIVPYELIELDESECIINDINDI